MSVLHLNGATYQRGEHHILKDLSWVIEKGQHWALLGANGSGKTTLLKIITGYEWVSDGEVEVLGQRFGDCNLRELRKRIGWVSSTLEHDLPARDSAIKIVVSGMDASIGLYRDFDVDELEHARKTLAMMNCSRIADQPYGRLSQGEQQRVLIARALVNRPALLILDEPCSGLDPAARYRFLDDLGRLTGQHLAPAIILVTHHIEEIHLWISHVLILKQGRCVACGTKHAVLSSSILSEVFDFPCVVENRNGLFSLRPVENPMGNSLR